MAALGRVGHERGRDRVGLGPLVDRGGRAVTTARRELQPAVLVDPADLLHRQEERGQRRRVVGLVLAGVLQGDAQVEERRHPAVRGGDPLDALHGTGRDRGEPQTTVRGEALLRGEVVDVDLARVPAKAAGGRGGVDQHERVVVGAVGPGERHGDTGRRLVVGERVGVDARTADGNGVVARVGRDDLGVTQVRGGLHGLAELGRELAEVQVLALVLDQAEGGDVPEGRGAAVAEQDLVAVGQGEHLGQAVAQLADLELHGRLPVAGAEEVAGRPVQHVDGVGPDTGRATAKASVGGEEVVGEGDVGGAHRPSVSRVRRCASDGIVGSPGTGFRGERLAPRAVGSAP